MKNMIYIQLCEVANKSRRFTFPSNPEKVSVQMGAKYQTFDLISKGTVKVPKGNDVTEIRWDGEFFGSKKKNEAIVHKNYYQDPMNCVSVLRNWKEKGTPLNLIITQYGVNIDVTISSFNWNVYGGHGNVSYSVDLAEWKELKIYTTAEMNIDLYTKKTVSRNDTTSSGNYTVISGDTLWGIAKRKLGGGANWPKIYNANKDIIEGTAKKHRKNGSDHGHWIYPGTTLVIPSS